MNTRRCEECRAVLDPKKVLRCAKCQSCFYCSAACQKRNWKRLHKRVCSPDPALRPYIPVEMALERVLAKQSPREQASKDATCYICLQGEDDGESSKLMRGCACRGDSAGFVHFECLTKFAASKAGPSLWVECVSCKSGFVGALEVEMKRHFWRLNRSDKDIRSRIISSLVLADHLLEKGEVDVANYVTPEIPKNLNATKLLLLDMKRRRAYILEKSGRKLEALELLQATLSEAKEVNMTATTDTPTRFQYGRTFHQTVSLLLDLDRTQEAYEVAAEAVAFFRVAPGQEDGNTIALGELYATACGRLGRVEKSTAMFENLLIAATRIHGRDHPRTQSVRRSMQAVQAYASLPESNAGGDGVEK